MHTTTGFRKSLDLMEQWGLLICDSRAFPPAEHDLKGGDQGNGSDVTKNPDSAKANETTGDNEHVEGRGEAKKPGAVEIEEAAGGGSSENASRVHATANDLPEVPRTEPITGEEPEPKRQKQQPSDQ